MQPSHRWDENATFGPPSHPISIVKFIEEATSLNRDVSLGRDSPSSEDSLKWNRVDDVTHDKIEQEYIRNNLGNPKKEAILRSFHDLQLNEEFGENGAMKRRKGHAGLRGEISSVRLGRSSTASDEPDLTHFEKTIRDIPLECWNVSAEANLYSRLRRNEDINSLSNIKYSSVPSKDGSALCSISGIFGSGSPIALITYAIFSRGFSFPHHFHRSSTHVALSTQTLGDVYDNMPCLEKFLPQEILSDDGKTLVGYEDHVEEGKGVVICVEGVVHGDGLGAHDYGEKLKTYINKRGPGFVHLGAGIHSVVLANLAFRLHQPYYLLHQGDCEHFIVFSQIRLPTPTDPPANYPLTIQLSPASITSRKPLCRSCNRLPAELSIVGDVRTGEPITLVCRMCWQILGPPLEGRDETAMVIRLLGDEGLC
ncbi:snRNA-activating protein of 50kDa MW C terminal-domain-containing protein [Cantharellus anzutake]|uniref:snRNA-activating protein of 50kDa MW C terminal-domain-containing protein n=1 Tax=Cantharellus anzutake TaxID=1750568 RepID=UPI001908FA7E|nr:snRNA-activating protein of 50kDa MW C terminal-domain-containing protein [Cantharellus anzutake]KAF8342178.1 snRNA-activating protein of 50kDa MW C terminal-domain-containing protein [Cantharellus anzutake]